MLIRLIGCEKYSYRGTVYEKGTDYDADPDRARYLLSSEDGYGRPFFVPAVASKANSIGVEGDDLPPKIETQRKRGRPRKQAAAAAPPPPEFEGEEVSV